MFNLFELVLEKYEKMAFAYEAAVGPQSEFFRS